MPSKKSESNESLGDVPYDPKQPSMGAGIEPGKAPDDFVHWPRGEHRVEQGDVLSRNLWIVGLVFTSGLVVWVLSAAIVRRFS